MGVAHAAVAVVSLDVLCLSVCLFECYIGVSSFLIHAALLRVALGLFAI